MSIDDDLSRAGAPRARCHGLVVLLVGLIVCGQPSGPVLSQTTPPQRTQWVAKGTNGRQTQGAEQNLRLHRPGAASPSAVVRSVPARTVLRWRTPNVHQVPSTPATGEQFDVATVVPATVMSTPVQTIRLVSLTEPAEQSTPGNNPKDAFADPFGDGAPKPAPAQPRVPATVPVAPAPAADAPVPPSTFTAAPVDVDDLPPQPMPAPASVREMKPAVSANCQHIYNERDCCKEGGQCDLAIDKWQHSAISKVSLDITPSFRPDEEDLFKEETERDRELSKAPVRTWRDRKGQVLATGRLTNIKRGRLLVLNAQNDIVKLRFDDLSREDLCFATAWWGVPTECTLADSDFTGRNWMPMSFTWKASAVMSKPLYFEETALERYGHTAGPIRQPILSGAHFFASLITLPYQAGINPPWECRYPLGTYRPGNCAPYFVPPIPLSIRGGLLEAGAWVGGIFLIP